MVGYNYGLLPQEDEDAIHNIQRLLAVESRPYQRVSGRFALSNTASLFHSRFAAGASIADGKAPAHPTGQKQGRNWDSFDEDVLLDLELFESSILRSEMLHNSNTKERERYAAAKVRTLANAQATRDHTVGLRMQLEEAKQTLEQRKQYDILAEKITTSKVLKPRDEQAASHAKLEEEIKELREQVQGFKNTWMDRRNQFARIVEEGREMLRMIKDEKEEVERKEGMLEDANDGEDGEVSTRGEQSLAGTPRPEAGSSTPIHAQDSDRNTSLRFPQQRLGALSRGLSAAPSTRSEAGDTDIDMVCPKNKYVHNLSDTNHGHQGGNDRGIKRGFREDERRGGNGRNHDGRDDGSDDGEEDEGEVGSGEEEEGEVSGTDPEEEEEDAEEAVGASHEMMDLS
ncbi:hypothetical protein GQ43DRAFT_440036 [Delitschia confertaspora ATCC 74209]|uniref:Tho complex subunit 7 n=1 Tax=Delitschia confertaspora ATCC 74209 TaxID=1513339 RepID=A0A9P4JRQ6_9PLEO|nr:hypothetical protein GQ43DRAFT_440036 [Delitschia confertaspora ATCC 74209]